MTVRAKFLLESVNSVVYHQNCSRMEMRTFNFRPVYSTDPEHENKKFWDASPQGSLQLGVVNKRVWDQFELGKEYYLDFTEAPSGAE
jgi:hypothetical protein